MRVHRINSWLSTLLSFVLLTSGVFGAFAITGVPTGGTAQRREIRNVHATSPLQWALFIQALAAMHNLPQNDYLSYFGISGIHGVPCQGWDGTPRSGNACGACVHQSNLFASWHRPYVTLFEMRMVNNAKAIAARYPANTRQQYVTAAQTLRLPFWDWAIRPPPGQPEFIPAFTEQFISVNTPTGTKSIPNPLFNYIFHPNPQIFSGAFNQYRNTMRYPTGTTSSAHSQENLAVATFARNTANTRASLFNFFSNCNNWLDLANAGQRGVEGNCGTTLETIHNGIHLQVGGPNPPQGHMTIIPYSAFDPVFMMHHCNVDRLFALWQALHPAAREPAARQNGGTFYINSGSTAGPNTPLKPFHSTTGGAFWTSASANNHRVFKYTYSDFANGGDPTTIRNHIRNLYGPQARATAKDKRAVSPLTASNGTLYEYLASVTTTRYGLGGSYAVYVFVDEPTTEDSNGWSYDPNLAGFLGVFADADMEDMNTPTTGLISLTNSLTEKLDAGDLSSLDEDVVTSYLSKNLVWKVVDPAGKVIDPDTVPDFLIQVYATTISDETSTFRTTSSGSESGIFSPYQPLDVTNGKSGGSSPERKRMLGMM